MRPRGTPYAVGATPPACAVVRVIEVPVGTSAADMAILSPEERGRASRFRFHRDRSSFVATRAALRRGLASELRMAPDQVPLVCEPTGRPTLAGSARGDLDFNVSHAGSLAVVAVARGRRVGVDVEGHRADRELRSLVPDVMGPSEREMLGPLEGAAFVRAFYACWTRKEAIVKGIGLGLSYPLAAIDIPELPPGGVVRVPGIGLAPHDEVWTVRTTEWEGGFTVSVAVAGANAEIRIDAARDVCAAIPHRTGTPLAHADGGPR